MPKHAGAQRNACDRCHTLKNRCVRPNDHQGVSERCERCERLELQCNYSEKMKTGRPKHKPRETSGSLSSHAQPDDQSSLDESRFSSGPVPERSDAWSSSHGDANAQAATLMPHGNPGFNLHFDNVYSQVDPFNWLSAPDGGDSAQLHAGVFKDMSLSETNEAAPLKELLDLQTQLHALDTNQLEDNARRRSGLTEFHITGSSNVSEIMVIMERLTGLLKSASIGERASSNQSTPPESVEEDDGKNTMLLLHVFSCYAYLLRLLKPLVKSLHGQCQGRSSDAQGSDGISVAAVVSLGTFSLASRPALNARMTLSLISNLVEELHSSARRVTFCPLQNRPSDPMAPDSPSASPKKTRSPIMSAVMLVLDEMSHEEDFVLQKLRSCTFSSVKE